MLLIVFFFGVSVRCFIWFKLKGLNNGGELIYCRKCKREIGLVVERWYYYVGWKIFFRKRVGRIVGY